MPLKNLQPTEKVIAVAVSGLLLGAAINAQAQVSGNAALTSDYPWHGSSHMREKPAIQVGFTYAHESGLCAAACGSRVEFASETSFDGGRDAPKSPRSE